MSDAILGLDLNDYGTSAALLVEGRIVAAAQEERFNREKKTRRFPLGAIEYCLSAAGLELSDLSAVAVSVNPALYLANPAPAQSERVRYRGELLASPLNLLHGLLGAPTGDHIELLSGETSVYYLNHHDCHAATALYLSPFESPAVCTADGFGERDTTVFYSAPGGVLERIAAVQFPHSLGMFYAAFTEFLGLRPNFDEWKLMAAAAKGDRGYYTCEIAELVEFEDDLGFRVDESYFAYQHYQQRGLFTPRLCELLGEPYAPGDEADDRFFDIAAAVQQVTEHSLLRLLSSLNEQTGAAELCLAGGVAYNCVLNGKVSSRTGFGSLFVPAMPDDSGTSIGAALLAWRKLSGGERIEPPAHNLFGPSFDNARIEAALGRTGARCRQVKDAPTAAAKAIADGKLVGWFQGRMEFGERALGARSILADPRNPESARRLAADVKPRPPWQPFAPSILAEEATAWFKGDLDSPFMGKTARVKAGQAEAIPAVVGADGSSRLHTVTDAANGKYHELLAEFDKLTGVPLVLNTSFNGEGEPIVCSPEDALRTFHSTGLDVLYLGDFEVTK